MPYTKTTWQQGITPTNQTNMSHLETQYDEATGSFNQDILTAFVLSGLVATKDVSVATQLDVTAGVAYLLQSADNTLRRRAPAAATFTTAIASTTYYLDLQPDGTWSWGTAHSGVVNYLPIAQVTTDASANISAVTDKRSFSYSLMPGAKNSPGIKAPITAMLTQSVALAASVVGGVTFGQSGALRNSTDGAALFNGTTGYLSVPASGLTTGNGAFSAEMWLKFAANPSALGALLSYGASTLATHNDFNLYLNTTGTISVDIVSGGTITSGALSVNTWHYVAFTWDGTTLRLYVDGASVGSSTPGAQTIPATGAVCNIGVLASLVNYLPGSLDEVALYNGPLSSTQITNHYNAGLSITSDAYAATILADSPVRYYRLGDTVGATSAADTITPTATTLVDAAGNLSVPGAATISGAITAGNIYGNLGGGPLSVNINGWGTAGAAYPGSATAITGCSVTAPVAGKYLVVISATFSFNTTGSNTAQLYCNVAGTNDTYTPIFQQVFSVSNGQVTIVSLTGVWIKTVTAGQTIAAYYSGGGQLGGGNNTYLAAQYLHS